MADTNNSAGTDNGIDILATSKKDDAYLKRARSEITKIGMYCGIRMSFYICILALMACYFTARLQDDRAPMAVYISFFCLVLAPVLNLLRKGPDQKEDFVLSTLKSKYKYSIEKYMINNLSYFGILMALAFWLKTTLSAESPVFYIPLIGVITLTAARILATLIFILVTRIRLARGKI